jgi:hypothetical protein
VWGMGVELDVEVLTILVCEQKTKDFRVANQVAHTSLK